MKGGCNGTIGASVALPLHLSIRVLLHPHTQQKWIITAQLPFLMSGWLHCPSVRHHHHRRRVFYGRENLRAIVVDGSWASCHGLGLHVKISQNKSNSRGRRKEPFGGCGWMWMCTLYLQSHTNGPAITLFTQCRSVGGSSGPVNSELTK